MDAAPTGVSNEPGSGDQVTSNVALQPLQEEHDLGSGATPGCSAESLSSGPADIQQVTPRPSTVDATAIHAHSTVHDDSVIFVSMALTEPPHAAASTSSDLTAGYPPAQPRAFDLADSTPLSQVAASRARCDDAFSPVNNPASSANLCFTTAQASLPESTTAAAQSTAARGPSSSGSSSSELQAGQLQEEMPASAPHNLAPLDTSVNSADLAPQQQSSSTPSQPETYSAHTQQELQAGPDPAAHAAVLHNLMPTCTSAQPGATSSAAAEPSPEPTHTANCSSQASSKQLAQADSHQVDAPSSSSDSAAPPEPASLAPPRQLQLICLAPGSASTASAAASGPSTYARSASPSAAPRPSPAARLAARCQPGPLQPSSGPSPVIILPPAPAAHTAAGLAEEGMQVDSFAGSYRTTAESSSGEEEQAEEAAREEGLDDNPFAGFTSSGSLPSRAAAALVPRTQDLPRGWSARSVPPAGTAPAASADDCFDLELSSLDLEGLAREVRLSQEGDLVLSARSAGRSTDGSGSGSQPGSPGMLDGGAQVGGEWEAVAAAAADLPAFAGFAPLCPSLLGRTPGNTMDAAPSRAASRRQTSERCTDVNGEHLQAAPAVAGGLYARQYDRAPANTTDGEVAAPVEPSRLGPLLLARSPANSVDAEAAAVAAGPAFLLDMSLQGRTPGNTMELEAPAPGASRLSSTAGACAKLHELFPSVPEATTSALPAACSSPSSAQHCESEAQADELPPKGPAQRPRSPPHRYPELLMALRGQLARQGSPGRRHSTDGRTGAAAALATGPSSSGASSRRSTGPEPAVAAGPAPAASTGQCRASRVGWADAGEDGEACADTRPASAGRLHRQPTPYANGTVSVAAAVLALAAEAPAPQQDHAAAEAGISSGSNASSGAAEKPGRKGTAVPHSSRRSSACGASTTLRAGSRTSSISSAASVPLARRGSVDGTKQHHAAPGSCSSPCKAAASRYSLSAAVARVAAAAPPHGSSTKPPAARPAAATAARPRSAGSAAPRQSPGAVTSTFKVPSKRTLARMAAEPPAKGTAAVTAAAAALPPVHGKPPAHPPSSRTKPRSGPAASTTPAHKPPVAYKPGSRTSPVLRPPSAPPALRTSPEPSGLGTSYLMMQASLMAEEPQGSREHMLQMHSLSASRGTHSPWAEAYAGAPGAAQGQGRGRAPPRKSKSSPDLTKRQQQGSRQDPGAADAFPAYGQCLELPMHNLRVRVPGSTGGVHQRSASFQEYLPPAEQPPARAYDRSMSMGMLHERHAGGRPHDDDSGTEHGAARHQPSPNVAAVAAMQAKIVMLNPHRRQQQTSTAGAAEGAAAGGCASPGGSQQGVVAGAGIAAAAAVPGAGPGEVPGRSWSIKALAGPAATAGQDGGGTALPASLPLKQLPSSKGLGSSSGPSAAAGVPQPISPATMEMCVEGVAKGSMMQPMRPGAAPCPAPERQAGKVKGGFLAHLCGGCSGRP